MDKTIGLVIDKLNEIKSLPKQASKLSMTETEKNMGYISSGYSAGINHALEIIKEVLETDI